MRHVGKADDPAALFGDERAPLLEQITGTAVYSDISRCVHERHREEKLKLSALEEELAAQIDEAVVRSGAM